MRLARLVGSLVLVAVAAAGCGCGGDEASSTATGGGTPDEAGDAADTLTLQGTVRLADGAELPSYPRNPMVPPPNRPELPEGCAPAQRGDAQPVVLGEGRGLEGVLVALHDFSTSPPHEPEVHEMAIRNCRLEPRLVVATRGDRLRITNETDYPFLPDLGSGLMQAILHERSQEIELGQGGVRSLQCGFAAPCGRAEIVTLYHPLHAVTEEGGRFAIEGVPTGEEVRVSAWHPLFQEASATLVPGDEGSLELVLEPAPAAEATDGEGDGGEGDGEGPAEDDPSQIF